MKKFTMCGLAATTMLMFNSTLSFGLAHREVIQKNEKTTVLEKVADLPGNPWFMNENYIGGWSPTDSLDRVAYRYNIKTKQSEFLPSEVGKSETVYINKFGDAVVEANAEPFIWKRGGEVVRLDEVISFIEDEISSTSGIFSIRPTLITDDGTVYGTSQIVDSETLETSMIAWILDKNTGVRELPGTADHITRWSEPYAMSKDANLILGIGLHNDGYGAPAIWENEIPRLLNFEGYHHFTSINKSGVAVGISPRPVKYDVYSNKIEELPIVSPAKHVKLDIADDESILALAATSGETYGDLVYWDSAGDAYNLQGHFDFQYSTAWIANNKNGHIAVTTTTAADGTGEREYGLYKIEIK